MSHLFGVLKGPCLTEKSNQLLENSGQVVFRVSPSANKIEIKQAVERNFNVKVAGVRTARVRGRKKRVGRYSGVTAEWKKAFVTLSEGEINFLEDL